MRSIKMKVLELNEINIKTLTDRANTVIAKKWDIKEWHIESLIDEINERDLDTGSDLEYEVSASDTKSGHVEFIRFRDLLVDSTDLLKGEV